MKMDSDYKPSESDIKTVMEAHDLLPEGPLLDEALGLASLYADRIRQLLGELPDSVDRGKAVLAIIEEGLMQEGFIPNKQEKNSKWLSLKRVSCGKVSFPTGGRTNSKCLLKKTNPTKINKEIVLYVRR